MGLILILVIILGLVMIGLVIWYVWANAKTEGSKIGYFIAFFITIYAIARLIIELI